MITAPSPAALKAGAISSSVVILFDCKAFDKYGIFTPLTTLETPSTSTGRTPQAYGCKTSRPPTTACQLVMAIGKLLLPGRMLKFGIVALPMRLPAT